MKLPLPRSVTALILLLCLGGGTYAHARRHAPAMSEAEAKQRAALKKALAQRLTPQLTEPAEDRLVMWPDGISPDGEYFLATHEWKEGPDARGRSLAMVRTADTKIMWDSRPTRTEDYDVFRNRLLAGGGLRGLYAWSPDSQSVALATGTYVFSWVVLLRMQGEEMVHSMVEANMGSDLYQHFTKVKAPEGASFRVFYDELEFRALDQLAVSWSAEYTVAGVNNIAERKVTYRLKPGSKPEILEQKESSAPTEKLPTP